MPVPGCRSRLVGLAESYLKNNAIGLFLFLNRMSLARYRRRFPELIVDRPVEAFNLVKEAYGTDSATVIIKTLLNILLGDPYKASDAVKRITAGDEEGVKRLMEEACRRLARP